VDPRLLLDSLLTPPILFFALGVFAVGVGSDLEVPQPIAKFLSLYLLFAIGMHGGHALHESGLTSGVLAALAASMAMAIVVPLAAFFVLRLRLGVHDAAAVAATYGSISAVTFVTAGAFLATIEVPWGGHMVAAMALMESPAIVIAVVLHRWFGGTSGERIDVGELLRETAFNGSVVLILGSLVIGFVTGPKGWAAVSPFADGIFKGMLSFFLLDLGLLAARRLGDLRSAGVFLPAFAIVTPVVSAGLAIALARAIGLAEGDAIMFAVLSGSASYIAVPAAMRLAIPKANPSLYVSMALALTFPFNILVGIPLYTFAVRAWWG
jgi:hypothetical protein